MTYEEFIRQFNKYYGLTESHPNGWLPCGSTSELPLYYVFSNPTDVDFLLIDNNYLAIAQYDTTRPDFTGTLLSIDTSGCHVGYAKLRKITKETQFEFFLRPPVAFSYEFHGPAWRPKKVLEFPSEITIAMNRFFPSWRKPPRFLSDIVYAVCSLTWPLEATEWKTRLRDNGWPSEDMIKQIVDGGCHLVAKPHQGNPGNETEWRFSFSKAELILILSWTDNQKYIYHILRIIKREVSREFGEDDKLVLCSYYFKTLMLWSIENKSSDFWDDDCIESSIITLVCEMIEWLIDRKCPNYFIRDNNMMDHLLDEPQINHEVILLAKVADQKISTILSSFPKANGQMNLLIMVPNELTLLYFQNFMNDFVSPQNTKFTKTPLLVQKDRTALALRNLYKAIEIQLHLSSQSVDCETGQTQMSRALEYFRLASAKNDECFSSICLSFTDTYNEFCVKAVKSLRSSESILCTDNTDFKLARKHSSCDPKDISVLGSSFKTRLKSKFTCCYVRERNIAQTNNHDKKQLKNKELNRRTSCGDLEKALNLLLELLFQGVKKRNICSSTFTGYAYMANFYYSYAKDYHLACSQYDIIISFVDQDLGRLERFNRIVKFVPVIITNVWSVIFDEHIQAVLGFLTLCKTAGPTWKKFKTKNIVVFLCPVQLLRYIRFQCKRILDKRIDYDALNECVEEPPGLPLRGLRNKAQFSRIFFAAALHSSGVKRLVK